MLQRSRSSRIEEAQPEWKDKFLSYKKLKKSLNLIRSNSDPVPRPENPPREEGEAPTRPMLTREEGEAPTRPMLTREEEDFMNLLAAEIEKSNAFFLDKEEEYIIRQKELQHRVTVVVAEHSEEQQIQVREEIVGLRGEIVLFLNYCAINHTRLLRILRKIEKRIQVLVCHPFMQKLLQQPLFTSDLLCKLEKDCESMLDNLFPQEAHS